MRIVDEAKTACSEKNALAYLTEFSATKTLKFYKVGTCFFYFIFEITKIWLELPSGASTINLFSCYSKLVHF